ncbi:MAG: hypothetical protein B6D44_05800 [Ignavibacteriales bacterium UTCHB2]|jgi:hypothetical protein|nr:MAG: Methylamine utilization protein MauE [Ignavibacteria bacterium ADurb.Bin266]OQY73901.1 MAG: hypothetical protein B6D44_05800 [Ignavibacteriales bacterium UTCHB2]
MITFLRILIGVIFLISSITKLFDLKDFYQTIYNFEYFSYSVSVILGLLILVTEFIISICFLLNIKLKIFSLLTLFLLSIFISATVPQILIGNIIDCNCFGSLLPGKTDIFLLLKDLSLFVFVLFIYYLKIKDNMKSNKSF